ncbi:FHIPEP family type III secretion protein, partial [Salmonella enterica]|uniref:FHIPEP family type III secretion protein n=1 Tax=Salmonella enterica TaxID=28901 RepID=UPI00398C6062
TRPAWEATGTEVEREDSVEKEVVKRRCTMLDFEQGGKLPGSIASIRKKFAQDMGFLAPVVDIRENMELQPARYRILMKGVVIGPGDPSPLLSPPLHPLPAPLTLPRQTPADPAPPLDPLPTARAPTAQPTPPALTPLPPRCNRVSLSVSLISLASQPAILHLPFPSDSLSTPPSIQRPALYDLGLPPHSTSLRLL